MINSIIRGVIFFISAVIGYLTYISSSYNFGNTIKYLLLFSGFLIVIDYFLNEIEKKFL